MKALINATAFKESEEIAGKAILINNDRIEALVDMASIPGSAERIDCENNYLAPGLIDLQIAGAGGYLFSSSPTAEALKSITNAITLSGTTGFLIAIPTNTSEVYASS
jgi:N-acetylglucosamine-6-phosphate deacetylase